MRQQILSVLSHLFPIKPHEWKGALLFFGMLSCFSFGAAIARSVGFTLLVGNLGKDFLPFAFIFVDLSVMLGSFAYVRLTKKLTNTHIVFVLMTLFSLFVILCWVLLKQDIGWAYGLFFIGFFALHILTIIHLGNFIVSYYTPVQCKRVMPFIYAGIPVGGALGGGALIALLNFLEPLTLILVLLITSIATLGIAYLISKRIQPIKTKANKSTAKRQSFFTSLKDTLRFIFKNPLLQYMTLGTLFFVLAGRILEFQYQGIIYPETFPDLSERSAFFGRYEVIANLIWLVFQLFISSRIITTLGVGASNLVHPMLVVVASGGLLASFTFIPALIAQFVNQELRSAIRSPSNNLLLNAIPRIQWPAVQAFINGVIFPLATILASSLLLWMQSNFNSSELSWWLPIFSLSLALLGIVIASRQWRHYNQGIMHLLSQKVKTEGTSKNLETELRQYLNQENPHQYAIALEMVRHLQNPAFIPLVGKRLVHAKSLDLKRECAKTLAALPKAEASLTYLIRSLHFETDPETLAILLLELSYFNNEAAIQAASRYLKHPYAEVYAAACFCLLQQKQSMLTQEIIDKTLVRLKIQNTEQQLHSIRVLKELNLSQLSSHVEPYLKHADHKISVEAFQTWVLLNKHVINHSKSMLLEIIASSPTKNNHSENKTLLIKKQLIALEALRTGVNIENWKPIISLLESNSIKLSHRVMEFLGENLLLAKQELIKQVLQVSTSLILRQRCLTLLDSLLSPQQENDLLLLGKELLAKYLNTLMAQYSFIDSLHKETTELNLGNKQKGNQTGQKTLILKLFDEQACKQLQQCLDIVLFLSKEPVSFSYRLHQGLRSEDKGRQGNALEALTNFKEKDLSSLVFTVFDASHASYDEANELILRLFDQHTSESNNSPFDEPFAQLVWKEVWVERHHDPA